MSDNSGAVTPDTIGEKRVRVQFNPAANGDVDIIKQRSAELINLCDHLKGDGVQRFMAKKWPHFAGSDGL